MSKEAAELADEFQYILDRKRTTTIMAKFIGASTFFMEYDILDKMYLLTELNQDTAENLQVCQSENPLIIAEKFVDIRRNRERGAQCLDRVNKLST